MMGLGFHCVLFGMSAILAIVVMLQSNYFASLAASIVSREHDIIISSEDNSQLSSSDVQQREQQLPLAARRITTGPVGYQAYACWSQFRLDTDALHTEHSPLIFSSPNKRRTTSLTLQTATVTSAAQTSQTPGKKRSLLSNESPVVTTDVMVCRTAKVGSTMIRKIFMAFHENSHFSINRTGVLKYQRHMLGSFDMTPERFDYLTKRSTTNTQSANSIRPDETRYTESDDHTVNANDQQQQQQYSPTVRIMFVRHPIYRLVAGYREAYSYGDKTWKTFLTDQEHGLGTYHSDCAEYQEENFEFSIHKKIQHWAPPQHCRCGISDCGIEWQYFHLEHIENSQSVLKEHLLALVHGNDDPTSDPIWMPPMQVVTNTKNNTNAYYRQILLGSSLHSNNSHVAPLVPENKLRVLDALNRLTRVEQEYFGYLPLTIQNILDGTADVRNPAQL